MFSGSTLVSRLDPCKPLASAAPTMDGQSNASHGKGRRHARAGKRRGKAGAGQGKGAPAGKAGASSKSAPAGKAGVQGERVGGQSGKRHQVVYAYPSVPGDVMAGAHILRDSQCRCCAVISGSLNIWTGLVIVTVCRLVRFMPSMTCKSDICRHRRALLHVLGQQHLRLPRPPHPRTGKLLVDDAPARVAFHG